MQKPYDIDLSGGVLFYPCSGPDIYTPVMEFSDTVSSFWFVDKRSYHRANVYNEKDVIGELTFTFDKSPELENHYQSVDLKLIFPEPTPYDPARGKVGWVNPLILKETLSRRKDGKIITVYLRRGDGEACLKKNEFDKISVFFYRGDSRGEGGSDQWWLTDNKRDLFGQVLSRMIPGGLIVTDGSNCFSRRTKPFSQHYWMKDFPEQPEISEFIYKNKYIFKIIGRVNNRYGPTYIWRMSIV